MRMLWVAFLLLAALSTACAGKAPFTPSYEGGPRLSFDRRSVDFGEVPAGKKLEATFRMQNVGDEPLVIEKAITRVVEGCCPPQPRLGATRLDPGEKTALSISFTMPEEMVGPHLFEILITSNDPVEPRAKLTVRALYVAR
jgi:hypothetical protein